MSLQLPRGHGLCVLDVAVPWLQMGGAKKKTCLSECGNNVETAQAGGGKLGRCFCIIGKMVSSRRIPLGVIS